MDFGQETSMNYSENPAIPCALEKCRAYDDNLEEKARALMEAARIPMRPGMRVLVKPNLLTSKALACTNPDIVAAVCKLLLDGGCKVDVADSPGFGRAKSVARAIGLDEKLAPLGLEVLPMNQPAPLRLDVPGAERQPVFMVSRRAIECDYLLSVPRIKAHSQMRITLAVKNLFGCVCGARKAIIHAREGREPAFFAACLAAMWAALPPSGAFVDGIVAMSVTGPSKGIPFNFGLLGACASSQVMDRALLAALDMEIGQSPLAAAIAKRNDREEISAPVSWPLRRPEDFNPTGFVVPQKLAHTSFRPGRLIKSMGRRFWAAIKA
ncbi:MAG: DUF362 domain-containing protein [Desulfovibrio sp.]|jgi:uncharacterized protein (DUF362 family)